MNTHPTTFARDELVWAFAHGYINSALLETWKSMQPDASGQDLGLPFESARPQTRGIMKRTALTAALVTLVPLLGCTPSVVHDTSSTDTAVYADTETDTGFETATEIVTELVTETDTGFETAIEIETELVTETGTVTEETEPETEPRVMFEEHFEQGLPLSWTQWSTTDQFWEHSVSEGVDGSGAALARVEGYFSEQEAYFQTPVMDLSDTTVLRLDFELAMANRDSQFSFRTTGLSVWYDNGSGWTLLSTYGASKTVAENVRRPLTDANSSFTSSSHAVDVTIIAEHDEWSPSASDYVPITIDLQSLSGLESIRFGFGTHVDYVDNSYMFIDDMVIIGG